MLCLGRKHRDTAISIKALCREEACGVPSAHRQACASAYSLAVGSPRGSVLGLGRVASQPRQASQIARGIDFCAVR